MRVRIFVNEDGSYGFGDTIVMDKDSFEVPDNLWEAYLGSLNVVALLEDQLTTKAFSVGAHPL